MTLDNHVTHTARRYDRRHDIVNDVDKARVLVGFHFRAPTYTAPRSDGRSDATSYVANHYCQPTD